MKSIFSHIAGYLGWCAVCAFVCVVPGCASDIDPEPPVGTGRVIGIQFLMSPRDALSQSDYFNFSRSATRTDQDNHPEVDSDDPFEDAIDVQGGDFAIYAFDKAGKRVFYSKNTEYDLKVYGTPASGYLVNTHIGEIDTSGYEDNLTFTIAVLANLESAGGEYVDVESITQLKDISQSVFSLPYSNEKDWFPGETNSNGKIAYIPMYGEREFTIPKTLLGDPDNPTIQLYEIGSITLLRALAKVEIIDAIDKEEGMEFPGITNVEASSFRVDGRVIPTTFQAGQQVTDITLSATPTVTDHAWGMRKFYGKKTIAYDDNGNDIKKNVNFWRIYIPEQSLADTGYSPKFSLTIKTTDTTNETREISLAKYTDFSGRIMRNHIYSIAVPGLAANEQLNFTICPMVTYTANIPDFN